MIPVTKPFIPPINEYQEYIKGIWEREYFTNNGPLVVELEEKIQSYLKTMNCFFVSNGTIALQIAIKALNLSGEIITTPFSYVATTSSIVWEGCTPSFVDIDPTTFNIDPEKIEEAINENTSAILATHVFGNPCEVERIQQIADNHNLKVIYDAAHCFGTKFKGKSIFEYGDISTVSFHSTKLFHTIEGGAIFVNESSVADQIVYLRNFGHAGFDQYNGVGINGKNSEFHAAMGIVNLKYIDSILEDRSNKIGCYKELLNLDAIEFIRVTEYSDWNYSYMPILLQHEETALNVKEALETNKIFPRRYFYPSLDNLNYVDISNLKPISNDVASRILCLPLYFTLKESQIQEIASIINKVV